MKDAVLLSFMLATIQTIVRWNWWNIGLWKLHFFYLLMRLSSMRMRIFSSLKLCCLFCSIKPSLSSKSCGSTGYYYSGTLDGSRPGVYCVNLTNLSNQYEIVTANSATFLYVYSRDAVPSLLHNSDIMYTWCHSFCALSLKKCHPFSIFEPVHQN